MEEIKLEIQGMINQVSKISNEFGISKTQVQTPSSKDTFTSLQSEIAHFYYSTTTKIDELTSMKLDTNGSSQDVINIAKKENEINQEIKKINEMVLKLEKEMSKRNKKLSEEERLKRQAIEIREMTKRRSKLKRLKTLKIDRLAQN